MKASQFIFRGLLAVVAMSASSVFAQEANAAKPLTRAEVKAETLRAERSGELDQNMNRNPGENAPAVGSPKTRAEVKAELAQAEKRGDLDRSAHDYPFKNGGSAGAGKTRAQVKAELAKAKKDGTFKTPRD